MPVTEHLPVISILIAARNEETIILDCLRAIGELNYPEQAWEVLIGNDQSTDQTGPLVAAFIADKPSYRLIDIPDSTISLRGKSNVLVHLAGQARGQFFFFTDADTQVPPEWLARMSDAFRDPDRAQNSPTNSFTRIGIATGITLPAGPRLFHKLQTIDWLYNLTLTHIVSGTGIPVTAMGNNMAVSREAYEAVGGYEALPFSVVEDYMLFRAITSRGFDFRNLLDQGVLAHTTPVDTLGQFLHQRKRWMRGAMDLPVWMVVSLYVQYLTGPLLLLLGWFLPALAVGLYLIKLLIQTMVISYGLGRLRQTNLWPYTLLFEIYHLIIGPLSVLFYWLSNSIDWKGRRYK